MTSIRWIEPGEWRFAVRIDMKRKDELKLKSKMVRDICLRCASEKEKAERRKEVQAFNQFKQDQRDKVIKTILNTLEPGSVKLRSGHELIFKDEKLRDKVASQMKPPKDWFVTEVELGGGIAF